jgi:riboflavin kinase / FMN adenylyltransferase
MRVAHSIHQLKDLVGAVVTLGNFDGLHVGHQSLVIKALNLAQMNQKPCLVFTFDPHPVKILQPDRLEHTIFPRDDLVQELEERGVDAVLFEPFSKELSQVSAQDFLRRYFLDLLRPFAIVMGPDFRFGRGREGTSELIATVLKPLSTQVVVVDAVKLGSAVVSSSRIRRALNDGDLTDVTACLGRPYRLWGEVVHGEKRGRGLGFPTANVQPRNEVLPRPGVYLTRFSDRLAPSMKWPSLTNVGFRPTFESDSNGQKTTVSVESYLLPYSGLPYSGTVQDLDLYGRSVTVDFLVRVRDEIKFPSADGLRTQIASDVEFAKRYFATQSSSLK